MAKDQMTIEAETSLRADFALAARIIDRAPETLLFDLMRHFSDTVLDRGTDASIGRAERQLRQDAIDYARGSIGLEGFSPSAADEAEARRFIHGDIDLAQFVAFQKELAVER